METNNRLDANEYQLTEEQRGRQSQLHDSYKEISQQPTMKHNITSAHIVVKIKRNGYAENVDYQKEIITVLQVGKIIKIA